MSVEKNNLKSLISAIVLNVFTEPLLSTSEMPSVLVQLTHLSLVSLLRDIGKQNSPRCDAADRGIRPTWGYSVCTEKFH